MRARPDRPRLQGSLPTRPCRRLVGRGWPPCGVVRYARTRPLEDQDQPGVVELGAVELLPAPDWEGRAPLGRLRELSSSENSRTSTRERSLIIRSPCVATCASLSPRGVREHEHDVKRGAAHHANAPFPASPDCVGGRTFGIRCARSSENIQLLRGWANSAHEGGPRPIYPSALTLVGRW